MDDQVRFYEAKLQYEIDPWDLNEALGRGDKIHLVDTRSPDAYGRSHIPGAVNIPHRTMNPATTAHLEPVQPCRLMRLFVVDATL